MPDEVVENLEILAKRENMSTSAFAARELAMIARRAHNRAILAGLPSVDIDPETIVEDLHAGRAAR